MGKKKLFMQGSEMNIKDPVTQWPWYMGCETDTREILDVYGFI